MADRAAGVSAPPAEVLDRWQGIDRDRLGVLLFISSESIFFASLITAFVLYRGKVAPSAGLALLDVARTGAFTVLLLASSVTIMVAASRLRRADRAGAQVWLLATVALGAVFLFGQVTEYLSLARQSLVPSSNLFGSTFYTLTGFHSLHVLVGLIAIAIVLAVTFLGDAPARVERALEPVSYYWHFVDGVWIVVFSVIYLWALV
jgi:heme/copper-type cytochrome/quinol oxidase subunit 3